MKKIFLLFTLLATLVACGCVARKTPGKHAFYSTKSPALTIEFNGLEYQGEHGETKGAASVQTYFYSGHDGGEGAWVEIISVRQGWNARPKQVPGESLPNTGIYSREIAGESYYCRTFLIPPESAKSGLAALPVYTAVRICTKLISQTQKISIGYAGQVNTVIAEKLFNSSNYGELTEAQKKFFAAFDQRADTAMIMDEFRQGDITDKVEPARSIKTPWYTFTDFLPLKRQIGRVRN